MNRQEYINQNALGFEGDSILKKTFEDLCQKHNITWIVETGTFRGGTTKHLSAMAERVDTIEVVPENFIIANEFLQECHNVTRHLGSSETVLESLFAEFNKKGRRPNLLCFLDAHWLDFNPLLHELDVIAKYKWKPVIIIHDFKVPGHPELGYDSYGSIVYEWDWIKEKIELIYGKDGFDFNYNSEAEGAKRGVIIITKK